MIVHSEGSTDALQDEANQVLDLLLNAYPGHPWAVRVDGGVIFIRHLEFGNSGWGMNLKFANLTHDAAVLKNWLGITS